MGEDLWRDISRRTASGFHDDLALVSGEGAGIIDADNVHK